MLDAITQGTAAYIQAMPKDQRKQYGQFFTGRQTAVFMADLFDIPENKSALRLLDPGAGSGILGAAVVSRLLGLPHVERIELTCWENDDNILPLLKRNLDILQEKAGGKLAQAQKLGVAVMDEAAFLELMREHGQYGA